LLRAVCGNYQKIIKTKLESVSLSCKSHRSKTANIKTYPQIQRTYASDHIFCFEFADKILILAVLQRWILQLTETDSCLVFIIFAVLVGKIESIG